MDDSKTLIEANLLNEDPISQLALLDKYVKVILIKNSSFEGYIHSIDPVTRSIILFMPQNDTHRIILLPGHAITEVIDVIPPANIIPPIKKQELVISEENIAERKSKLVSWLKQNLLPVSEVGDNIVFGNVLILPPYSVNDLCTDNSIVALQVREIIESMPANQ